MYNELVYHLDLCIMAYQLYAQSLVWPMDPFYEEVANKGAKMRTNFMDLVREDLSIQGRLDPIAGKDFRINLSKPALVRDEAKNWLYYSPNTYITNKISKGYIQNLDPEGSNPPKPELISQDEGTERTDNYYCFEGKTGNIKEETGIKSIMGLVLSRQIDSEDPQSYDVHIAFRGSRAGFVKREFVYRKNPDWVTDLDTKADENPYVSKNGTSNRGFAKCLSTMNDPLVAIFQKIQKNRGKPPRSIYIAGHSLGGALANCLAAALMIGDKSILGEDTSLEHWPWETLKVFTYGCPAYVDKVFRDNFNAYISCKRVLVEGDPIPTNVLKEHSGVRILLDKLNNSSISFDAHDVRHIRIQLLKWMKSYQYPLDNVPAHSMDIKDHSNPVVKFDNFKDVLKFVGTDANKYLTAWAVTPYNKEFFKEDIIDYLGFLAEVQAKKDSYNTPQPKDTELIGKKNAVLRVKKYLSDNDTSVAGFLNKQTDPELLKHLDSKVINFLKFCSYFYMRMDNNDYSEFTNDNTFEKI